METGERRAARPGRSFRSWAALAPAGILVLFGGTAVALYAAFATPLLYPYWSDAPAYIEAARSLLSGEPLLISVPYGYDDETAIFRLWPPGFPVLIAAVASSGIDAAVVALWLTRLSVAALPLVVYWAIRRAVGTPVAVAAALLSFSAVGMFPYAHRVSSDPPFALVVMLSLGFLLRGLDENRGGRSFRSLVIAGLLTALAVGIRNSGVALILAEGATLAALWIAKDGPFARMLRQGSSIAVGLGIGLVPLLIWNFAAFGELMPYRMPPSTIGVNQNVVHLISALQFDLLPIVRLGGRSTPFLAALFAIGTLAIIAIGVAQLRAHRSRADAPQPDDSDGRRLRVAFAMFAACYSLISAVMLVAARSRYEWGEIIAERHVAQFDWLLVAAAFSVVAPWLAKRRAAMAALLMVAACLIALRAWYFLSFDRSVAAAYHDGRLQPRMISLMFSQSRAAADLIAHIPNHCDIISNAAEVIQVTYKRRSRMVWAGAIKMEDFANLRKPSVLIFVATPSLDIRTLQPPSAGYRTIRDPVFVAFESVDCR